MLRVCFINAVAGYQHRAQSDELNKGQKCKCFGDSVLLKNNMTATASAVTASVADEDLDECGPQLITKLEVSKYHVKLVIYFNIIMYVPNLKIFFCQIFKSNVFLS